MTRDDQNQRSIPMDTNGDTRPGGPRGIAALAGLGLVLAAAGCGNAQAGGAEQEAASEDFSRVINVEVEEVHPRPFVEQIRLTGTVRAERDVELSAEEAGVVEEVLAEKGAWMEAGEPIARLNDDVLSAQAAQARAQSQLAQQTWERRKRLWEEDRVGSEIAYLEARFAAEQTRANLRSLEERLERMTIRAPFSGILEDRMVDVGSMVSPGQAVARMVDRTPVKVTAGVPERYAADVRAGSEAVVTFDVLPDEVFQAPISFVGSTVDPQNRTFPIEVRMPNPGGMVKPEMVADVSVERRSLESAMVVPQNALVRVEDGYVVFVVSDGDGVARAEQRRVELGPSQRDMAVVESGLEPGERLIVVGQKSVAGGDRVNVVASREQT
jgi:membrane fusion protein (multidrug efflux system)